MCDSIGDSKHILSLVAPKLSGILKNDQKPSPQDFLKKHSGTMGNE